MFEIKFDQINMCSQCLLKFWTQRLKQLFLLASKCGLHVCPICILSLISFHYLGLRNRMSYINLSKFMFSICLKPNYIIHTSHSLIFPHLEPSPIFFFFLFFSLGFESNYKSLILPSHPHLGLSIGCS